MKRGYSRGRRSGIRIQGLDGFIHFAGHGQVACATRSCRATLAAVYTREN